MRALCLAALWGVASWTHFASGAQTGPHRIVTLAPSVGEIAALFVGSDTGKIVGVSEWSDEPPFLKSVASVGPYTRPNIESVLALKPDLVLATQGGNPRESVERLKGLGLNVVVLDDHDFASIESSIRKVGSAMGESLLGEKFAGQFRSAIQKIRARSAVRTKASQRSAPRVLLQVGEDPLVVAGANSFLNEALEAVGAKNVYSDLTMSYPRPSVEDVIQRKPDLILILHGAQQETRTWSRLVSPEKVRHVDSSALMRASLRLPEGLAALEKAIYRGP